MTGAYRIGIETDPSPAHQGWAIAAHDPETGPDRPADLLFLHGMAAGGWIWRPGFLARFQRQGYRAWTLSLPGRAAGPTLGTDPSALDRVIATHLGRRPDRHTIEAIAAILPGAGFFGGPSLADLAEALSQAIAAIGRPVIVVAHSLGGAVAQALLQRRGAAAMAGLVLVCAVPPYGLWRASTQMAWTNPALWQALADFSLFGLAATDPQVIRANLFPRGIPDRDFAAFVGELRDESLTATLQCLGLPPFAPLPGRRSGLHVIGAGADRFIPAADVRATAAYYGTWPVILPGAGHAPMLEDGGTALAQAILDRIRGGYGPSRS